MDLLGGLPGRLGWFFGQGFHRRHVLGSGWRGLVLFGLFWSGLVGCESGDRIRLVCVIEGRRIRLRAVDA